MKHWGCALIQFPRGCSPKDTDDFCCTGTVVDCILHCMFVKHIQLGCYGCDMLWLLPILSPHDNARTVLSPRILCGLLWQCVIALQAHGQCHGQCPEEMFGPLTMGTAKVPWRSLARHPDATASESLECTIIWFVSIWSYSYQGFNTQYHAIWGDWTDVNRFFDFSKNMLTSLCDAITHYLKTGRSNRSKHIWSEWS